MFSLQCHYFICEATGVQMIQSSLYLQTWLNEVVINVSNALDRLSVKFRASNRRPHNSVRGYFKLYLTPTYSLQSNIQFITILRNNLTAAVLNIYRNCHASYKAEKLLSI